MEFEKLSPTGKQDKENRKKTKNRKQTGNNNNNRLSLKILIILLNISGLITPIKRQSGFKRHDYMLSTRSALQM